MQIHFPTLVIPITLLDCLGLQQSNQIIAFPLHLIEFTQFIDYLYSFSEYKLHLFHVPLASWYSLSYPFTMIAVNHSLQHRYPYISRHVLCIIIRLGLFKFLCKPSMQPIWHDPINVNA